MSDLEDKFRKVYESGIWGKPWHSGQGSTEEEFKAYLDYIVPFIEKGEYKSILDYGSGDGRVLASLASRLPACRFTGYDIVSEWTSRNAEAIPGIEWTATEPDLSKFDLILCKDVIHHLPYAMIEDLLAKFACGPAILITADFKIGGVPADCEPGGYHRIDLMAKRWKAFKYLRTTKYAHKACWTRVQRQEKP